MKKIILSNGLLCLLSITASAQGNSKSVWLPCSSIPTITYGSQTYNTVEIGGQCWFQQNLNYGNEVADVTQESNNGIAEKTCYSNATINCNVYGGIYSWDEAMNYGTNQQGICPNGWHIPTQLEWQALISYLGSTVGEQMKVDPSNNPPWDGTNTSGFTAIPGGIGQGTAFLYQGTRETFWSSTQFNSSDAYDYDLSTGSNFLTEAHNVKVSGYCIRCILDNATGINNIHGNKNNFSIYPNPANSKIEIRVGNDLEPTNIELINITGQIVKAISTVGSQKSITVSVSELAEGIYFVKIQSGENILRKKFTIVH